MYNHSFERVNYVGFKERKVSESLPIKTEIFRSHSSYIRKHLTPCRRRKVDINKMMIMMGQC